MKTSLARDKVIDQSAKVRIVHLNPGVISGTYGQNFQRLIPAEVNVIFEDLGLLRGSRYEVGRKADEVITGALEFTRRYDPNGLIIAGAPLGGFNPGLEAKVSQAAGIPVVMAMPSVIAAVRALSAKKLIVMTPWDEKMNGILKKQLVASNPAMLWHVSSLLGHKFSVKNYGTLLQDWPKPLS